MSKEISGAIVYFRALEAASDVAALAQLQCLVREATEQHNSLLKFGKSPSVARKTANLALNMAEVYGELAAVLAGKVAEVRQQIAPESVAS